MSKQNILRSAAGLMISGILAKTVDFLFRAYYATRLGSEGMGLFSLVFSFHGLILTVATGGLGVAVSKTVSEQYAQRDYGGIKRTMAVALSSVLVLSSAVILGVSLFSSQIAEMFLKEPRTQTSIIFLAPSILFMSISYCIKGYFYAARKVIIPASSEFLEQAVKIVTITYLLNLWLPDGIVRGCEAVFLGISIGEFSSCLYLTVFYIIGNCSFPNTCLRSSKNPLVALVRIALPAMITSLAGSFLRMQEDVLILSGLRRSGLSRSLALSEYGSIKGMVMPLIVFPLTLLSSFFTLLVPEISRAQGMADKTRLKTLFARIYRFTLFGGFLVCTVFTAFAEELSAWVYSAPQISRSVQIIALLAPIMFLESVSCGILNGLGKQTALLTYSLSDSALRLVLIYLLIPRMGIKALFFVIFISNIFTAYHTFSQATRSAQMRFNLSSWMLRHFFTAAACLITLQSFYTFFPKGMTVYGVLAAMAFTVSVYILYGSCLYKTLRQDIRWFIGRMFLNK